MRKNDFEVRKVVEKRNRAFVAWDVREMAWRKNFEDAKMKKAAERAWERYQDAQVAVFDARYA